MARRAPWLTALCACVACSREAQLFEARSQGTADASVADASATSRDGQVEVDAALPTRDGLFITTGSVHACAIEAGKLFCWGDGEHGKLGLGDALPRNRPTRVGDAEDWLRVCASEEHSCALARDGSVHCWGQNDHGQLGLGDVVDRDRPTPVPGLSAARIACGGANTCALTRGDALYCWGENLEGKLGQDDPFDADDIATPIRVAAGTAFRDVSIGQGHVCAIASDGALWCWGRNTDGQLGIDDAAPQLRAPTPVTPERAYERIACGQRHSCAIDVAGDMWCWGTDSDGSLGLGVAPETLRRTPQRITSSARWREVDVDWFHTCAVSNTAELSCWGRNAEGQLGLGNLEARNVPARASGSFDEVGVGRFFSCGVRGDLLSCWGEGAQGQLGLGDEQRRSVPTIVALP